MPTFRTRLFAILASGLLAAGCRDTVGPDDLASDLAPAAPIPLARLECTLEVPAGLLSCAPPAAATGTSGPSYAILGSGYIAMRNYNYSNDTIAQVAQTDVTVQNLLPEPMGTPDGTTLTGVKVFYEKYPVATSYYSAGDTGTVIVRNADGVGTFTRADQPYYEYNEILVPGDTSHSKLWQWNVPKTVKSFSFSVLVYADVPSETRVPSVAPAGVPEWIYADSMIMSDPGRLTGELVKDVVVVLFKRGTPQPKRRATIDTIGGTVVGGRRLSYGDGYYYVQVPGDGTAVPVLNAVAVLRKRGEVQVAVAELLLPLAASVLPSDGVNFREWQVHPDSADGQNWGPEAISAPLAWGCSRGDTAEAVAVAVLDHDFHSAGDLSASSHPRFGSPHFDAFTHAVDTVDHGTKVASIVGAKGDNATGVTGTMYSGYVRLYEIARTDSGQISRRADSIPRFINLAVALDRAASDGAAVINISLGLDWDQLKQPGYIPGTPADSALVSQLSGALQGMVASMASATPVQTPLFVIAAGNNAINPYWSAFPNIASAYPRRTIIVAAARNQGSGANRFSLASFSNRGGRTDIAAPGDEVYTLNRSGDATPVPARGTSYAAPYVTGVAGLLIAFDPRLRSRPDTLKDLIMRGARRAGRYTGGAPSYPVLNAHEALKVAAERRGAPLCGNPVYQDTLGRVFTRRDSAWTFEELMFTTSDSLPEVLHGGKRIRLTAGGGYAWASGNWQQTGTVADTIANATIRSKRGLSHGMPSTTTADSTVTFTKTRISLTQERFDVFVNGTKIAEIPGPLAQKGQNVRYPCIQWDLPGDPSTTCTLANWRVFEDSLTTNAAVSFSPAGDTVVLAISRDSVVHWVGEIIPMGTYAYRRYGYQRRTLYTELYHIPIRGGTPRVWTYPYRVEAVGVAEDGRHMAIQSRDKFIYADISQGSSPPTQHNICRGTYAGRGGNVLFTLPPRNLGNWGNTRACYPGTTLAP